MHDVSSFVKIVNNWNWGDRRGICLSYMKYDYEDIGQGPYIVKVTIW